MVDPGPLVQLGEVSAGFEFGSHNFTELAISDTPGAFVATSSFVRRFFVWMTFLPADDVSGFATGTGAAWHMAPSKGVDV